METAAVAQTAVAHRLPWVAVRAISDSAADDLTLDYACLWLYLDADRPAWRQRIGRWCYLLTHATARQSLRYLRQGLALAAVRASRLVEAMLQS